MNYVIGVDIGGTCTDCVILDEDGLVTIAKVFSTPPDFSEGVVNSITLGAEQLGVPLADLLRDTRLLLHATTVAENAIIEGDLARAGLLTTRGFEDTLRLMRGAYPEWAGKSEEEIKNVPYVAKPDPLIPPELIRGVRERTDVWGDVLSPADEDDVTEAVDALVRSGAETLGICFLWAFANPENEVRAGEFVRTRYPDIFLTLSHEVAPVLGEFERSQTVALNSRLGPTVATYLGRLQERLREHGYGGTPLVMQAYGGLLDADKASRKPVGMIESGPASGLVGSRALGQILGYDNIIGADMGGTTFKAGVIQEGRIDYAPEPMVSRYHYASPKMNMESIGVAGGSIISLDPETGSPRIGPQSAGSTPGPVCYGRGGEDPTITDVDLILGYLDQRYFLGGREPLDATRAREAFKSKIADGLGMDVREAAGEAHRLANSMIYDLLHKLTVERGLDPRSYVLFSTGGTAGMHVGSFAPALRVSRVIIPHAASVHGALGLVSSDVSYEDQVNRLVRVPGDSDEVNTILDGIEAKIRRQLHDDGFAEDDVVTTRAIEMRYRRQVHVISVPLDTAGALTPADVEAAVRRFTSLYEERFGHGSGYLEAGIEMVNFRVHGTGLLRKPVLTGREVSGEDPSPALVESREVYFAPGREFLEASCYAFEKLAPGNVIEGPAILWSQDTTVVVNPGQRLTCDPYKNLELVWESGDSNG
jgi:N-methylhydantoinase A